MSEPKTPVPASPVLVSGNVHVTTASGWEVVDLCSTNGTRINGYQVVGAQPLRPGDIVSFGEFAMTVA